MWMNNEKTMSISVVFLITALGFAGIFASDGIFDEFTVSGAMIIVDPAGDGNYTCIQTAINSVKAGDSIYIWSGTYYENLKINKGVTLIGNGTQNTIINGNHTGDVVYITANSVKLTGFTITNSGNRTYPYDDSGIELNYVSDVHIFKNNVSNNYFGIFLNNSNGNLIEDNLVGWSSKLGISCWDSDNNTILRNNCSFTYFGIGITYSGNNSVIDNICISNLWAGILVSDSAYNYISRNKCFNGKSGVEIWFAINNDFNNNTFIKNSYCGIAMGFASSNIIQNNSIENNYYVGIRMEDSMTNSISYNNITCNRNGVYIIHDSGSNKVYENLISSSTNTGILIERDCKNNVVFHNNIISNPIQAKDNEMPGNKWYTDSGGNYWSDYTGVDNGFNGRLAGDGIGDTDLPHLGLDDKPFIQRSGWLKPGVPVLKDPGVVDPDGNYTVAWDLNPRAIGYILEEDETTNFESPTEIFNGLDLKADITNKAEGIYYYRLKAYIDDHISNWSNAVDIIVDFLPDIPREFKAVINPEGNAINLTWELNTDETKYYELEYKDNIYSDWAALGNPPHPINYFEHTELENHNTYFYRIRAIDSINQTSNFSTEIDGTPEDSSPPSAPEDLVAMTISDTEVALTWSASPEPDVAGYIVYMTERRGAASSDFEVVGTINDLKTSFSVNGLSEQTTYQFTLVSFDEVPLNSKYSNTATATTIDVTPPEPPVGLTVSAETNSTLELSWRPNFEPDLVGYHIFRGSSANADFERLNFEPVNNTKYLDTKLDESTTYYYKIIAVDDFNLTSGNSQSVSGTTKLGQYPPEINNSIPGVMILEDSVDDHSINLLDLFKDVNGDQLMFDFDEVENITVIIYQNNGTIILIPKENWNGEVTVTFYAMDGIFTISEKINISVIYCNDPPCKPEITSPKNGIEVTFGDPITLTAACDDPDLIYGDSLYYSWRSDISGKLGNDQTLKDIDLEVGKHTIEVEVVDIAGKNATETIIITVYENEPGADKEDNPENYAGYIIFSVIIIVLICILFLFIYKKKKRPVKQQILGTEQNMITGVEPSSVPITQPMPVDNMYDQYTMMNQYQYAQPMYIYKCGFA